MKFVIIGGDAAGMSAASRAKRRNPDLEVVVLELTDDVSYSACGMPYNIADPGRPMDDLVVRKAQVFRDKQGIDLRTGHRVDTLNRADKNVTGIKTDGGAFEVQYDKLLIATGSRAILPDIPGKDLPGVLSLKSLQDGRMIKDYMQAKPVNSVLVVGLGYIGLEMVEAYHTRGVTVEAIDLLPSLLPWLPDGQADVVAKELESKGVSLRMGVALTRIEEADNGLEAVLSNGDVVQTDMVLMGVGVRPNSEFAADAGLELGPGNAIAVDRFLLTSDPDIYAAGDCADAFNLITGQRVWIPLALRANRAGWAVADNIRGADVELPGIVGTSVFKVLDLEVARTGLSVEEAQAAGFAPVLKTVKTRSRAHAHPGNQTIHIGMTADRESGRLLGATMVGKEGVAHRINAVAVALHAGMTVEEFVQCDMAYAPPFSPVWDPLLTAGNQLLKSMG
ncbi:FAD-dependent oxidoreductase [Thermodesulfobacteriota bacterium]